MTASQADQTAGPQVSGQTGYSQLASSVVRRSLKFRLLLFLAGSLSGLLLAESGLRLAGVSYPQPYEPDEWCGSRLKPGLTGYWSKEGSASFSVNSFGFRDREWRIAKPAGCLRVAILGDSYIEAFQVADDETFGRVLERELNSLKLPGVARVEVLSFGVSGFGTAQELLALRHHALQFEPDIVLLAFLPANDLRNNSTVLEPEQRRPFFKIVDGALEPDFSFRHDPRYLYASKPSSRFKTLLINSSRLLQLVQAVRNRDVRRSHRSTDQTLRERIGLDDQCFLEPSNADWQDAWTLTERLIEEMQREVTEHDAMFSVAVVTSGIQVNPDDSIRQAFSRRLGVATLDYAERRLERLGTANAFPVIRLSDQLLSYAKANNEYLHGFANTVAGEGHWNATGHREAARICAKALNEQWAARR
jgi:lysophospholipase L1-like esterase